MMLTDSVCQEKREEVDLSALTTAWIHRYNNLKTTYKWAEVTRNNTNDWSTSGTTIIRKQKWEEQLYGHFKRLKGDLSHEKTLMWLRKGNLKRETEYLLIATQNNAISTKHIKARIDKTQQISRCTLYSKREERSVT